MAQYFSLKMFRFLLVFAVWCLGEPLCASERVFDSSCSVKIVQSQVEIYPPGKACLFEPLSQTFRDYWCVRYRIDFDNGLYAANTMIYDQVSYYEGLTKREFTGDVNIVLTEDKKIPFPFSLIFQDGRVLPVTLWANDFANRLDLPRIRSLQVSLETIPHWFYTEKKLEYVIELDDGTHWMTPLRDSVWMTPWYPGSRVLKLGTSENLFFVNLDSVYEDFPRVISKDYVRVSPSAL